MIEAKCIRKATVPPSLLPHPSPASLQPNRLALLVNHSNSSCSAFFASGSRVFTLQISVGESHVNEGKEGLLIPAYAEVVSSLMVERCPHRYEIQSIELKEIQGKGSFILGSVDSYGHLVVSELDPHCEGAHKLVFAASPQDCGVGEGSWSGLSFNPSHWSMVAVARSFPKCIDIYEEEFCIRNLQTLWHPSSLTYVQSQLFGAEGSILAVTEACQLTIWDLRMKENGGCLQRLTGSPGDTLFAVATSSMGNIAVGGADRTVTIYDPRRWSALSRWIHCSKYEITGLEFSSVDPDYIYVQGLDYEVFCGQWSKSTKIFSFRGDSNWLGFTKCSDGERDVLGGWCDSGSIFVADIADLRIS